MTSSRTPNSPMPRVRVTALLWRELLACLQTKSARVRESGAFLLGTLLPNGTRVVESFVPYDEVEPRSFERLAVRMTAAAYSRLYGICDQRKQLVVADIHAHPTRALQSPSDRANPMMPVPGHVALIVPNYAQHPVRLQQMTFNLYEGPDQWNSFTGPLVAEYLEIRA